MKLQPHDLKRLKSNALLLKQISSDAKLEVTKKDLGDWNKEVLATLQRKKQIKNMLLVLVEIDGEKP